MSNLTRAMMMGAAGVASGGPLYVDDVFSTYLYDGDDANRSINNGIDLAGEGGLVWIKSTDSGMAHMLFDTERGVGKFLESNATNAEANYSASLTAFNSNGFSLFDHPRVNSSSYDYASWTFRKAPGFFDVVTYTGTGVNGRTVSHSLGSVPGMIIIKQTSAAGEPWYVQHRYDTTKKLLLSGTNAASDGDDGFQNTAPTSSVFTVAYNGTNKSGDTYVAYIFAHNDASFGTDEDQSIIKCGSYTGNGNSTGTLQNLGFEPQWLLIKNTTRSESWLIFDQMRGVITGGTDKSLEPQATAQEQTQELMQFESVGFRPRGTDAKTNRSGDNFIYMAIRRPHKPPEAATEVFNPAIQVGTVPNFASSFPVDFGIRLLTGGGNTTYSQTFFSRLTGEGYLPSSQTNQEAASNFAGLQEMNGWGNFGGSGYGYSFKRAPGFMDVVAYTGTGANYTSINHGLGVVPEMFIIKRRDSSGAWAIYQKDVGAAYQLYLNTDAAKNSGDLWQDTGVPTSTQFFTHNRATTNASGGTYVGYFFATLPGISKVGTYTGSSGAVNVDCGFTNGARFVMVKKTSGSGDWVVWDTVRGIGSGNDPYIKLNETQAQITNQDLIAPLSSGFTINNSGVGNVNASGQTYIFLAIA
jgi:hypothetical protein